MHNSESQKHSPSVYLPLTPGQKWCMDEMQKVKRPGWYCIDFIAKTKMPMDEQAIRKSVYYLVNKYESLRVKISNKGGQWVQEVYPLSEAVPFTAYDFSGEDIPSRTQKVKQLCVKERDEMLAAHGNLVRILFFRFSENDGRIWFCLHHMVSDFVSILIFTNEFMAVYNSIMQGKELKWQTTKDYRKWLYMVEGYCRDVLVPAELDYWLSVPWHNAKIIPSDYPHQFHTDYIIIDAIQNNKIVDTYKANTFSLDQETTAKLFSKSAAEFEDMLIAVFFLAIVNHKNMDWLDINVCNSGRNILPADYGINVNNLFGFLATTRPLLLKKPGFENLLLNIRDVIAQMKSVPNAGMGFILLRGYVKDDEVKSAYFNSRQLGEVFFNYLGRVNKSFSNEQYEIVDDDTGLSLHDCEIRNNLLACDIGIKQNQLFVAISYSELYFKPGTIEEIIQAMMAMFRNIVSSQLTEKVA